MSSNRYFTFKLILISKHLKHLNCHNNTVVIVKDVTKEIKGFDSMFIAVPYQ